jgi:hypothetical protein
MKSRVIVCFSLGIREEILIGREDGIINQGTELKKQYNAWTLYLMKTIQYFG